MAKRISRKELKKRTQELKRLLTSERAQNKLDMDLLKQRFRSIGIRDVEPISDGLPCETVEIPLEPWGKYAYVQDDERIIEEYKGILVRDLAKAMIDDNIVQFIVKTGAERDTPLGLPTVGVKLYCVPWEKVNRYKNKIVVHMTE